MDIQASIQELSAQSHSFFEELKNAQPDTPMLSPTAQEGLYVLAHQALQAKQYSEAFGMFSGLVAANISQARYMSGMAHAAQGAGQLTLAVRLHAMAAGLAPGQDAYLLDLAQGLLAIQQFDLAKAMLQGVPADSALAHAANALAERAHAMEALLEHSH